MDNKNLYEQIGNIKEEFATEARNYKRIYNYKKYISLVASFVVIMACIMVFKPNNVTITPTPTSTPTPSVSQESSKPDVTEPPKDKVYDLIINEATGLPFPDRALIIGHFWNDLTENEINSIFTGFTEYDLTARADYSKVDGKVNIVEVNAYFKMGDTDITLTTSNRKLRGYCMSPGEFKPSNIEGIDVFVVKYDERVFFAEFKMEDVFYRVEFKGDESNQKYLAEIVSKIILSEKPDFSALNPIAPEKLLYERLTLEEAYQDADFGKFIPKELPQNFSFDYANRFINQESDYLYISFLNGMDYYRVNIRKVTEIDKKRITSVEDTENYDLSLYTIPIFESVPKELRDVVDNPIFKIEDLKLDVVKMRSYTLQDIGDTNGERMEFSILYGNILVEFSSKGLTSSQVYDMLMSIN